MKRNDACLAVGLLSILLMLLIPQAANAADPIRVGTMTVQRYGDHGTPLILIPGLASGGWVWDDLVARLKDEQILYVVTLAGFDGTPPVQGKLIDLALDSLLELIRSQKIDKPVLIGHSLGGTLAIRFAQQHSDLISGVIAVDGLPVLPGTEMLPANNRAAMAENIRTQLTSIPPAQFAAQQLQFMRTTGVLNEALATGLAARTSRSDPAAVAQYTAEDIALDLRHDLPSIKVPLLEICPYNAADIPQAKPMTEPEKAAYYRSLLKGTPSLEVISIAPSRHFVMFDQPEVLANAINRFLSTSASKATNAPSTAPK